MPGVSPVARYEVVVPGTELVTRPSRRMRYRVGNGPAEGADQKIAAEVSAAGPAVSRVGGATGGPGGVCLVHGAQIIMPAAVPARAATALTALTRFRRLERCLAVAPATADEASIAAEAAGLGTPWA